MSILDISINTGKHLFACVLVMSLDNKEKYTGFLRLCLPVLLQQNLRCKVRNDTAKIRYNRTVCHQWTMQRNYNLRFVDLNINSLIHRTVLIQNKRIMNTELALPLIAFNIMLIWDIREMIGRKLKHATLEEFYMLQLNGIFRYWE